MKHWNRIKHYRDLASEALQSAETAPDDVSRAAYIHIAASWQALAQEAERLAPELREKGFREDTEGRKAS